MRDGSRVPTNVVRQDGQQGALLTILKSGGASTLDIIEQVKKLMPSIRAAAPPGLEINLLFDQETPALAVQSPYTHDRLQVTLKEPAPLFVRLILVSMGSAI